jgi:hypothetical protein
VSSHLSLSPAQAGSYPHLIRLRGPWQIVCVDGDAQEAKLPCDLDQFLRSNGTTQLRLIRRFGLPTNLEPDERIELVIETARLSARVHLNDEDIGEIDSQSSTTRLDVTDRLQSRNELVIDVLTPTNPDTPNPRVQVESVRLEITLIDRSDLSDSALVGNFDIQNGKEIIK